MTEWLTTDFLMAALNIVFIDVLLAGDNAVLIALAVRQLTPRDRRVGILVGAGGAVLLRIALTFFATRMLNIPLLKLGGGLLILWIAIKLLKDDGEQHGGGQEASTLWQAMWLILVADVTMSLDNILAIAGASKGHFELVVFGLALSIPFVVFASNWLSGLMERFPLIVIFGAAILGKVGAEMILTDPWVAERFHPGALGDYAIQAACALGVVLVGKALVRRPAN
ncbi:MAG: TerC family protein [Bryobacteraceae bacterium]|nr:TerC family protein [Bryobacteraceae bacterium]